MDVAAQARPGARMAYSTRRTVSTTVLWDNVGDAPQNIQRDDLVEASTEKSALGETQTLIEDVVDDTILEMATVSYTHLTLPTICSV